MSNLSDLLTAIGSDNGTAVGIAGGAIGLIADFSGVGGAVSAVEDLITSFLTSNNQIADALTQLQSTIQQGFSQVDQTLRATQIIARQQALVASTAQAESTIQSLLAGLSANPPVDTEYKLQQIQNCLNALDDLDQDVQWMTVMNDEIYFTGDWSQPPPAYFFPLLWTVFTLVSEGDLQELHHAPAVLGMPPAGNGDGTAFSDRYVLPLFMKELGIFLAVATAYDPNYRVDYADALNRYAQRLIWVYNLSAGGITSLQTPTVVDIGIGGGPYTGYPPDRPVVYYNAPPYIYLTDTPWLGSNDATAGLSVPPPYQYATGLDQGAWGSYFDASPSLSGVAQPYGVVHTYTGTTNMVAFPPLVAPQSGPPAPAAYYIVFLIRLCIAGRARWKELHSTLGLTQVVDTANQVLALVGQPPFLTPNPGNCWTLREIAGLFVQADPNGTVLKISGHISARAIALALKGSAISQTAAEFKFALSPSNIGLRAQLQNMLNTTLCSGSYTDALPPGGQFGKVVGWSG